MAGTKVITTKYASGNRRVLSGTGTASTTLTLETGLGTVTDFSVINLTTATGDKAAVSGGTVTVTTAGASDDVIWRVEGY
jgi:hypothetical protein